MTASASPTPARRLPFQLPPLGFGAFKIGRNQGIKYPTPYDLPSDAEVERLIHGLLDLGCTYFDTAPAYGLSEERLGRVLSQVATPVVISTKVGETFENGISTFDYSRTAVERSLERSRRRLQREVLDLVLIHSSGDDLKILRESDVVAVLREWREQEKVRAIGLSGKTVAGAQEALSWADALMVEYHLEDTSHAEVMQEAADCGVAVLVKKPLASGRLNPEAALAFALGTPAVTSLVVGGLNFENFRSNWIQANMLRERY